MSPLDVLGQKKSPMCAQKNPPIVRFFWCTLNCHRMRFYNRNIIKRHSDESSGCTTTGCSNVKGRSVYAINNPPPPPMLPSSAACRPFTPHRDEKIMDTYKLEVTPVSTADPDSECTTLNPHTQLVTTLYP